MILRIGAGDLNAVVGLFGLVAGIGIGSLFIKKGFSLPRNYQQSAAEGLILPAVCLVLFVLFYYRQFHFQKVSAAGAAHAPVWMAITAGLIIG